VGQQIAGTVPGCTRGRSGCVNFPETMFLPPFHPLGNTAKWHRGAVFLGFYDDLFTFS